MPCRLFVDTAFSFDGFSIGFEFPDEVVNRFGVLDVGSVGVGQLASDALSLAVFLKFDAEV